MNNLAEEGSQGICLDNWHVPKDSEWYVLENYLKDSGETCDGNRDKFLDCDGAGDKIKSGGSSGFEAVLVGVSNPEGKFFCWFDYIFMVFNRERIKGLD
ncbi:fibrobacter succinogenes major paralogous domain-containing protein [Patescibacteria group bacterium]|nr:fibrobacter succinogenes major paralogous domain-containing protein [Patescibacteria group bacterium]